MASTDVAAGTRVRLLGLPDWLLHDLPADGQQQMRGFAGRSTVVTEVDAYGCFRLGFGSMTGAGDDVFYCGHPFCVPREFLQPCTG